MPFVSTAITSMCLSIIGSGLYNEACNKAAEAGTKQTGVYQTLADGETKTMIYATEMGVNKLGKTTMEVGAAGVFLYRAYRDKAVTFKLKRVPLADSMTSQITKNSYNMSLNWHF